MYRSESEPIFVGVTDLILTSSAASTTQSCQPSIGSVVVITNAYVPSSPLTAVSLVFAAVLGGMMNGQRTLAIAYVRPCDSRALNTIAVVRLCVISSSVETEVDFIF